MPIRILVVEDDCLQSEVIAGFLSSHGYYVETAANGLEALRKVRIGCFDLVLMDYSLPEVDGLAAARLISDITRSAGRPRLIALSASPQLLADREVGAKTVFDAIESKPWNPESLLASLKRCHEKASEASYRKSGRHESESFRTSPLSGAKRGEAAGADGGNAASILVVEDDTLTQGLLKLNLEASGYQVDTATNGLDGLRKIARNLYDVVILDLSIPEISGVAAAKLMFELIERKDRPRLIAFTATSARVEDREFVEFDEVVDKSDGMPALLGAVKRSIDYRRQPRLEAVNVVSLAMALGEAG